MVAGRRNRWTQEGPSDTLPENVLPERRSSRKRAKVDSLEVVEVADANGGSSDPLQSASINAAGNVSEKVNAKQAENPSESVHGKGKVLAGDFDTEGAPAAMEEGAPSVGVKAKQKEPDKPILGADLQIDMGGADRKLPILPQVEGRSPGLLALLSEFEEELQDFGKGAKGELTVPLTPFSNASYLKHLEFVFVLRAHRMEVYRALKAAVAKGPPADATGATPESRQQDLDVVETLLKSVEMLGQARLASAPETEHPLVHRLAGQYGLSAPESDMLKLLFCKGASCSTAFRTVLGSSRVEDREWEMLLCGMSALGMDEFLDDKRMHILEGIVLETEDYDGKVLRMLNEAIKALLGSPLRTEQRLKLSRTELLNVMDSAPAQDPGVRNPAPDASGHGGPSENENGGKIEAGKKGAKRSRAEAGLDDDLAAELRVLEQGVAAEGKKTPLEENGGGESGAPSELQPYRDSLEYLDDSFQVLALQMRVSKARHQEDLKEAGNAPGGWYDGYNYKNSKTPSTRELKAKLKFAQTKLRERIALTEAALKDNPPADVILPLEAPADVSVSRSAEGPASAANGHVAEEGKSGETEEKKIETETEMGKDKKGGVIDGNGKVDLGGKKAEKRPSRGSKAVAKTDGAAKQPAATAANGTASGNLALSSTIAGGEIVKGAEAEKPLVEEDAANAPNGTSSENLGEAAETGEEEKGKMGPVELPRLEALARKLGLDEFEKGVVTMLTGVAISPVVKSIYEADDGGSTYRRTADTVQVKDILTVFLDTFKDQVSARPYFYKSSRLVSKALIKIRPPPYTRSGGDLMDQQVELDRRMLDWIVGLDTEMNELVEGSHLYHPKISMEHVVLPDEQKEVLLRTVDNYAKFKQYRHTAGLEDVINYGAGLVILLCGASGTGKTMTVNAIAHHLGKRVLLVDFQSLSAAVTSTGRGEDQGADLRGLFRDAEMNDAVIFFDECEAIFAQRERGGDRLLNALLTEMERHEGIIMLATNRPLDLDEAMHRRITCVSEFRHPDHTQRKRIWELSSRKLPLEESLDWEKIALRYELTGGYIKNALVSALLLAISRSTDDPKVTEGDIIEGCQMQMRGSLQMKAFLHRVVPKTGLDDLVLSGQMRKQLESIVNFEKARAVMVGSWGFAQERVGTAALFWGIHGSGKSAAAEAIGFELGRPLKVVNCSQLVSHESSSKTGSAINATFKDARLMDAVLVLEDFQVIGNNEEEMMVVSRSTTAAIGLLLYNLERFPGVCILIANDIQGGAIRRLDPELTRRLRVIVEFKMPDAKTRGRMWRKLLPEKVPLAPGVDFDELGRRFEFNSGAISGATVRAAAKVALRPVTERLVTQKDLFEAAEAEKDARRDEIDEVAMRAFI